MKCDIIIPVWDELDITRECLDSILRHTDYPYRLIVIDNGSSKETEEYLRDFNASPDVEILLIRNSQNVGFVKAVNQGISASDAPYICIMNNDTIATEGWLGEMVSILEADHSIGLINPSSNTSGQLPPEGLSIDDYASTLKTFKGKTQELSTCRGFCMVIKSEAVKRIGLFDEAYDIGYFEETDYSRRSQRAGFRIVRSKASYVFHKENVSFKKLIYNRALFRKNEKTFFKRWGRPIKTGYFVDSNKYGEKVDSIATDVARLGHQINIFIKKGLKWPVRLDHFDIRKFDVNPFFFGFVSLYKILKRKKKKKLEVLLTDDAYFGKFLNSIKFLHGSDVIIKPERDNVIALLKEKASYG